MKKKNYEGTDKWNILMKKAFIKKRENDNNEFITKLGIVGLFTLMYGCYVFRKWEDK